MITAHGVSDARRAALRRSGLPGRRWHLPARAPRARAIARTGGGRIFPGRHRPDRSRRSARPNGRFSGSGRAWFRSRHRRLPTARSRYGIISQTTQPIERVRSLVAAIRRARPAAEVRFVDTVCKPTKDRQLALQDLIAQAEAIVVVGGRESNNTRQLVETCRRGWPARHSCRTRGRAHPGDFAGCEVVGVTAGTSTLPETVEAVRGRLLSFAAATRDEKTCGGQIRTLLSGGPSQLRALVEQRGFQAFRCLRRHYFGRCWRLWRDGRPVACAAPGGFYRSEVSRSSFSSLVAVTRLLNGCSAQLLGSGLTFRQTSLAILSSFAITALTPRRVDASHAFSSLEHTAASWRNAHHESQRRPPESCRRDRLCRHRRESTLACPARIDENPRPHGTPHVARLAGRQSSPRQPAGLGTAAIHRQPAACRPIFSVPTRCAEISSKPSAALCGISFFEQPSTNQTYA